MKPTLKRFFRSDLFVRSVTDDLIKPAETIYKAGRGVSAYELWVASAQHDLCQICVSEIVLGREYVCHPERATKGNNR